MRLPNQVMGFLIRIIRFLNQARLTRFSIRLNKKRAIYSCLFLKAIIVQAMSYEVLNVQILQY